MAGLVFVDTDILIDLGRGVDEATACLHALEKKRAMAISVITQMELMIGCRNKSELNALEHFLDRFIKISVDKNISETAVSLLKQYHLSHGL